MNALFYTAHYALVNHSLGGKEVGIDARVLELPRTSKLQAQEPVEEKRPANYSVLPKVVAKFKPPTRKEPAVDTSSAASGSGGGGNDAQSTPAKQAGISAASFYGTKRHQQL